ncbi:MAG: hypothetical protein KDJ27_21015 [Gammaproteobacteria bacterium]|nr:hypothetical protein [Gammaproteobacteria bacterium]MCB1926181.1 hypothetical protein [Gammaproteobacteria bacterium]
MNRPKTIAKTGLKDTWLELTVVYGLTLFVLVAMLKMNVILAIVTAPLGMLVAFVATVAFVHLLWITVLGLERIGTSLGMRKSPLS